MAKKNIKFEFNPLFSGPSLESRTKSGSPYRLIPLSEIDVDPEQPRRNFDPEALSELAASIKEFGVMTPILVRVTAGGTYRVVAGERRLRASRLIDLDTIPAIVDLEDSEEKNTLAKQLVENLQREDLSAMERGMAIAQLRDKYQWSVREIAKKLGSSKSLVQRSLDLLELPEDLIKAISDGLAETKVSLLKQIDDIEIRAKFLSVLEDVSRVTLEEKIFRVLGGESFEEAMEVSHGGTPDGVGANSNAIGRTIGGKGKKAVKKVNTLEDKRIIEEIQKYLGTKVKIFRSNKKSEQGKMLIEFYSNQDLNEIHQRLIQGS